MNPELLSIFNCRDHRSRFEASISLSDKKEFKKFPFFSQILDNISPRDEGEFTFENENDDIFVFKKETKEYEFNDYINSSETLNISLIIDKKIIDSKQSIYYWDSFLEHLIEKPLVETFSYFHKLFSSGDKIIQFEILDPNIKEFYLHTKSIYFRSFYNKSFEIFNRADRLFKVKNTTSFYNQDKFELLPDDFHVTETNLAEESIARLKEYFSRIEMILGAIYIATSSEIKEDILFYQLNDIGQTLKVNLNDKLEYNPTIFEIYNWIYNTDNYIDKSSIARSVFECLCMDIFNSNSNNNVIRDLQKSYNIYIKEKVNIYLDAKKDLSEYIIESISKLKNYTNTILETFLKNLYAIIGFFFSVILANAISDRELDKIFTKDILIIIVIALIGSIIFWLISNLKFRNDLKNFKELFDVLKKNYEDVLLEREIENIFNSIQLDYEIEKVKNFKRIINWTWGVLLGVSLLITTTALLNSFVPNIKFIDFYQVAKQQFWKILIHSFTFFI